MRRKAILCTLALALLVMPVGGQETAEELGDGELSRSNFRKDDEAIQDDGEAIWNNNGPVPLNRDEDHVVTDLEECMNSNTTILISALIGLIGVLIGGIITFYLNYAKTKAMMRWELKYNIYVSLLEFDTGRPLNTNERDNLIRLANRLKSLSKNKDIKEIATALAENKFVSLKDKQTFMDEKFIPAVEKDLQDTMKLLKWRFWKRGDNG